MDHDIFCNPFDELLARQGPPAVFLPDREGMLRFDETWTRDAWGRAPGPHGFGAGWRLLRDHATGYVMLVMVTSPTLLTDHPRADVRCFASRVEAQAVRGAYGAPPICAESWGAGC